MNIRLLLTTLAVSAFALAAYGQAKPAAPPKQTKPVAKMAQTTTKTKVATKTTSKTKISARQADRIALKKVPGKLAGRTKLENEEGTWEYAVIVRSGKVLHEVMVNAKTGKVDKDEVTTKTKEAKEAGEEKAETPKAPAKKPAPKKKGG
jgi:uncharacterized membrane protein YkoI